MKLKMLTVLLFVVALPSLALGPCWYDADGENPISAAFVYQGLLYYYYWYHHYGDSERAGRDLSGTIEFQGREIEMQIDPAVSGGAYQTEQGFTAIGLRDNTNDITVEVVFPGREAGSWSSETGKFRVVIGGDEYTAGQGSLRMELAAPYPEVGDQFRGTVSGKVVGDKGEETVTFTFDVTNG